MPGRDLSTDLALLTEAAHRASAIAMRFWRHDVQVWHKDDNQGPVTEADLAVNDMLKAMLLGARPGYGWLSEESPNDPARLLAQRTFIIDPIDGTRAFIAGEDNFAVSMAVAEAGRIVAAVVMLPAKNRLYSGETGGQARCNGLPIRASTRDDLTGADILATKSHMEANHWPGGVPDLKRSFRTSLAYRMCLAAEGRYDGMVSFRDTWEWDIAAGALICECAGARVTDRHGAAIRFNSQHAKAPGVIATNPALHGAILSRLGA